MDCRSEAREFLQSRRAKLSPQDCGLPAAGARRRVPGLRREEVALLAGVSVDYYARLEKGRLETASPAVLDAIARALQLDQAERAHLNALARAARGEDADRSRPQDLVTLRAGLAWTLDAMHHVPAYIRNGKLDVLASNMMGRALYQPFFDSGNATSNLAMFCFLSPGAREFFPDWVEVAEGTVALLRAEVGRNPTDTALNRLVAQLAEGSAEFRTLWASHDVRDILAEIKRIRHPAAGTLTLAVEAFSLQLEPWLTMVTYAAEPGSPSQEQLSRLAESVQGPAADGDDQRPGLV